MPLFCPISMSSDQGWWTLITLFCSSSGYQVPGRLLHSLASRSLRLGLSNCWGVFLPLWFYLGYCRFVVEFVLQWPAEAPVDYGSPADADRSCSHPLLGLARSWLPKVKCFTWPWYLLQCHRMLEVSTQSTGTQNNSDDKTGLHAYFLSCFDLWWLQEKGLHTDHILKCLMYIRPEELLLNAMKTAFFKRLLYVHLMGAPQTKYIHNRR